MIATDTVASAVCLVTCNEIRSPAVIATVSTVFAPQTLPPTELGNVIVTNKLVLVKVPGQPKVLLTLTVTVVLGNPMLVDINTLKFLNIPSLGATK